MEPTIMIALITGIVGLATAIFSSFFSLRQSKKIIQLNHDLEIKKNLDEKTIEFLLTYDTQNINQALIILKDYLKTSQYTKDKLRDLIKNRHLYFDKDILEITSAIKNQIIEKYSNSVYVFNKFDIDKHAHSMKNKLCEVIDQLCTNENPEDLLAEKIKEISVEQEELQIAVEIQVKKMLDNLKENLK